MKRIVQPEILDTLPPDDPRAIRSRRDLKRVNGWMCNHGIMVRALEKNRGGSAPGRITELGAGDGNFLLRVAQKISPRWPETTATLLDLQNNVSAETLAGFATLGWHANLIVGDVFDWPRNSAADEIVIANLFLHHFEDVQLTELLRLISQRAKLFIAVEPHRFRYPAACAQLLRLVGCSAVTLHDAAVSIRAGFIRQEISPLWPDKQNWRLTEQRAGAFSHLFIARRTT